MIQLEYGDWSLTLREDLGASVTALAWRGRDILRPAPSGASSPLETSSFPLVPYTNRIDRGLFTFAGREVTLPATAGFEPHALHGVGWQRPWQLLHKSPTSADLMLKAGPGPDWPWAWTASHRLSLDADGLEMTLSITNDDLHPMPAGVGLHPYFVCGSATVLTVPAARVWLTDAGDIPIRLAPAKSLVDWRQGVAVATAPQVDNAYTDAASPVRLEHGDHTVHLTASHTARCLHVFAPKDSGFVCLEPVTHRPNAHNAPADEETGLVTLLPGQTLTLSMRITAVEKTV